MSSPTEVCSIYGMGAGDLLELAATHGLNPEAVGRTRLRVGEGIVGITAATGTLQNLADAQAHPAFAYRPETGEERLRLDAHRSRSAAPAAPSACSPSRTASPATTSTTSARCSRPSPCCWPRYWPAPGTTDGAEQGLAATLPRQFAADPLAPGAAVGPVVLHGIRAPLRRLVTDDPAAELARLDAAGTTMRQTLEELIESNGRPRATAPAPCSRPRAWSPRTAAGCAGCARRSPAA